MVTLVVLATTGICIGAMIISLHQPGGCIRYSFLCSAVYLVWIVPQFVGLSSDSSVPDDGFYWLSIMIVLCLSASLIGWRVGVGTNPQSRQSPSSVTRPDEISDAFWPLVVFTATMYLLHAMIGLQPVEDREQSMWSGPLTIIVFFLTPQIIGLFLSVLLAMRNRSRRALLLAGANIALGSLAFVGVRRGGIINFGVAFAAAYWFGSGKRVSLPLLIAAIGAVAMISYAIGPLRIAAKQIELRTGSAAGLFSPEVWRQVDFTTAIEESRKEAVDLANAAHIIDYANKWGDFTYGRQSWDRFVFQWVPAQILGTEFKQSLMWQKDADFNQIQAEYGYTTIVGTTPTGFGFGYAEFGVFGCLYFLLIGLLMGRIWRQAETGDIWAQSIYVSCMGYALLSITHHAMTLLMTMPLFYGAMLTLKHATRLTFRHRRSRRSAVTYAKR